MKRFIPLDVMMMMIIEAFYTARCYDDDDGHAFVHHFVEDHQTFINKVLEVRKHTVPNFMTIVRLHGTTYVVIL